jgi:hypothetical protein
VIIQTKNSGNIIYFVICIERNINIMANPNRNVIPLPAGFGANALFDERIFVRGRPLLSEDDNRILDAMLRERYEFRGVGDIRNKIRTLASFRRVLQNIDLNQGEQAQRVHGRVSQLIQALEQFRANNDNNDLAAGKKKTVRKSKKSTSRRSKKSTSKKSASKRSKKSTSKKSASKRSKKSTSKKSASKRSKKSASKKSASKKSTSKKSASKKSRK